MPLDSACPTQSRFFRLSVPSHVTELRPTQLLEVKTKISSVASFAIDISASVLPVPLAGGLCEPKLGLTDPSLVLSDHLGPLSAAQAKFYTAGGVGLDHVQSLA